MELKKNEKLNTDGKRRLYFMIGLNVALGLCILAFEWKSEVPELVLPPLDEDEFIVDPPVVITQQDPPPPPLAPTHIRVDKPQVATAKNLQEALPDAPETKAPPIAWEPPIESLPPEVVDNAPIDIVEDMPEYPGGWDAFFGFLAHEIHYPSRARRMGHEGTVYVQFVVERDGSLSHLEVVKGATQALDTEALRAVGLIPESFVPGRQRGRAVRVRMVIPIAFRLQ